MAHNIRRNLLSMAGTLLLTIVQRAGKESDIPTFVAPKDLFAAAVPSGLPGVAYNSAINGSFSVAELSNNLTNSTGGPFPSNAILPAYLVLFSTLIFGFIATLPGLFLQYFLPDNSLVSWAMFVLKVWDYRGKILSLYRRYFSRQETRTGRLFHVSFLAQLSTGQRRGRNTALKRSLDRHGVKMRGYSRNSQRRLMRVATKNFQLLRESQKKGLEILRQQGEVKSLNERNDRLHNALREEAIEERVQDQLRTQLEAAERRETIQKDRVVELEMKAIRERQDVTELRDTKEELASTKADNTRLVNELKASETARNEQQSIIEEKEAAISRFSRENGVMESAKADNTRLIDELKASETARDEQKSTIKENEAAMSRLSREKGVMEEKITHLNATFADDKQRIIGLEESLGKAQNELTTAKERLEDVKKKRDSLDDENEKHMREIEETEEEVERMSKDLQVAKRDLLSVREELRTSEGRLNWRDEIIKGHRSALDEKDEQIAKLEGKLDRAAVAAPAGGVDAHILRGWGEQYDDLEKKYLELQREHIASENSHEAAKQEIHDLQGSNDRKKDEIADLRRKMDNLVERQVVVDLQKTVEDKDQEIDFLTSAKDDDDKEKESAAEEMHLSLKTMEAKYEKIANKDAMDSYTIAKDADLPWVETPMSDRVKALVNLMTKYCDAVKLSATPSDAAARQSRNEVETARREIESLQRQLQGKQTGATSCGYTANKALAAALRSRPPPGHNDVTMAGDGKGDNGDDDKVPTRSPYISSQVNVSSLQDVDMTDAVGATQRDNATPLTSRPSPVTPGSNDNQSKMDTSEPAQSPIHTPSGFRASNDSSFSAIGADSSMSNFVTGNKAPNLNQRSPMVPKSSYATGTSTIDGSELSAGANTSPGVFQKNSDPRSQQQGPFTSIPPASAPKQASSSVTSSTSSSSASLVRRPQDKRRTNGLTFGTPSRHARKAAHRLSPLKHSLNDSDDDENFYIEDPDPKKPAPIYNCFNKLGSLYDPNNPPASPFKTSPSSSKPSSQSNVGSSWSGLGKTYQSPSSSPAYTSVTGRTPLPGLSNQSPAYKPPGPKPGVPFQGSPPFKGYGPNLPAWLQKAAASNGSPISNGSTPSKPSVSVPTIGKPKDESEESEEE